MRKALWPAAVLALACVVSVVAQQREPNNGAAPPGDTPPAPQPGAQPNPPPGTPSPDRPTGSGRDGAPEPPSNTQPRRAAPAAGPNGPNGPNAPNGLPPGMEGARLEWFLVHPGRVLVRDTWRVGRIDCRPWDNAAPGSPGALRIHAVVAYSPDHPDDRAAGLELILQDDFGDHTFLFDPEQLGDLLVGLESVRTAAEAMRDPPPDVGRRATFNLNGLEIGMSPRRTGGYLAPLGPDEQSVGLNPDNFQELKRLLTEAQTILKRETDGK